MLVKEYKKNVLTVMNDTGRTSEYVNPLSRR